MGSFHSLWPLLSSENSGCTIELSEKAGIAEIVLIHFLVSRQPCTQPKDFLKGPQDGENLQLFPKGKDKGKKMGMYRICRE